jgi:hypothetical protein
MPHSSRLFRFRRAASSASNMGLGVGERLENMETLLQRRQCVKENFIIFDLRCVS